MVMKLRVTMADGSQWDVPVEIIAENRAKHYAKDFDGDLAKSLQEDTIPLFESDEYEIIDWAQNNMDWVDVEPSAVKQLQTPLTAEQKQSGWVNGEKTVIE